MKVSKIDIYNCDWKYLCAQQNLLGFNFLQIKERENKKSICKTNDHCYLMVNKNLSKGDFNRFYLLKIFVMQHFFSDC